MEGETDFNKTKTHWWLLNNGLKVETTLLH